MSNFNGKLNSISVQYQFKSKMHISLDSDSKSSRNAKSVLILILNPILISLKAIQNQHILSQIDRDSYNYLTQLKLSTSSSQSDNSSNRQATRSRPPADFAAVPGAKASKIGPSKEILLTCYGKESPLASMYRQVYKLCSYRHGSGIPHRSTKTKLQSLIRPITQFAVHTMFSNHLSWIRVKILLLWNPQERLRIHSVCIFVSWTAES